MSNTIAAADVTLSFEPRNTESYTETDQQTCRRFSALLQELRNDYAKYGAARLASGWGKSSVSELVVDDVCNYARRMGLDVTVHASWMDVRNAAGTIVGLVWFHVEQR